MDIFFLSWAFDARWFFNFKNPCRQLIFTIPFLINVACAIMGYIQKGIHTDLKLPFLMENLLLLFLLALSNLYIIWIVRLNTQQKISKVRENYMAIQQFYHDYQIKKNIWSFFGLIVTIVSICRTFIQNIYIERHQGLYPCETNKIRYWIDVISYIYIGLNILIFLIIKVIYLTSAWVLCPKLYLQIKKVIS